MFEAGVEEQDGFLQFLFRWHGQWRWGGAWHPARFFLPHEHVCGIGVGLAGHALVLLVAEDEVEAVQEGLGESWVVGVLGGLVEGGFGFYVFIFEQENYGKP